MSPPRRPHRKSSTTNPPKKKSARTRKNPKTLSKRRSVSKAPWPFREKIRREWSGRPDLNRRPLGPQPSALPDCATSRRILSASPIISETPHAIIATRGARGILHKARPRGRAARSGGAARRRILVRGRTGLRAGRRLRGPRGSRQPPLPPARHQGRHRQHQGARGVGGPRRRTPPLRLRHRDRAARVRPQVLPLRQPPGEPRAFLGRAPLRHEGLPARDEPALNTRTWKVKNCWFVKGRPGPVV